MKLLQIIMMILLFIYPNQQKQNTPVYEGIYTETGYGKDENGQAVNAGVAQSYYVKIYNDKLIVNTYEFGTGKNIDIEYKYIGTDSEGCRLYASDQMNSYRVDANNDIERVFSMPWYGGNVWRNTYMQVVKGERYQEYNQMHQQDGSSPESQYWREVLKTTMSDYDGYGY